MTNAGKVPTTESTARSATRLRPPHAQGAKRASMLGGRRRPSAKRAGRRWGAPLLLWVAGPLWCTLACVALPSPSGPPVEPSASTILVDGVASGAKSGEPFYVTADDRHVVTVRCGEQSTDLELIVGAGKSHEARVVLEEKKRSLVLPAVAFGVGGAGLVLGIVASVLAASKTSELRATCGQALVCPTRLHGDGDLAVAMAHTSTVGFVLAGAGAAVGAVMLLLPVRTTKSGQVAVTAGPAFVGLKGAF